MKFFKRLFLFILLIPATLIAQQKKITGTVKNSSGQPMSGVSVRIEGMQQGLITNEKGAYTIQAKVGDKISFSFVGWLPVTKTVGAENVIDVVLEVKVSELEEVVTIGYGTQKKSDLTGSVVSITAKDMQSLNAATIDRLLQGQVAGVSVTANSGAPGDGMKIRIRGSNSMNGSNEPLYVIDGFPIEINPGETAADQSAGDAQQYSNILSTLNPNDIERIEVLKDASATAIYGSKGANGVVIITTKKGSALKGKDVVDVNYSYAVDQITRKIPMLEPWEWARNLNKYISLTGVSLPSFNGQKDANGIYRPSVEDIKNQTNTVFGAPWGVNWQDEIFQAAPTHNLSVSLKGRSDRTNYIVSGNALTNEGIVPNTNYQRLVLRGAITRDFSKNLKLSLNTQVTRSVGNQKPTAGNTTDNMGVILNSLRYNNVLPAYLPDGSYFNTKGENSEEMSLNHPLVFIHEVKNKLQTSSFLGSLGLEYTLIKGLTIRSNLNYRYGMSVRDIYFPHTTIQGDLSNGLAANSWSQTSNFINENFLNYNRTFNKNHQLGVMAGFSYEQTDNRSLNIRVFDFFSDDLEGMKLGEGALPQIPDNEVTQTMMASYYGRVNYSLNKKYLLTATFRGDGSSKFGKNNKWAYFPSFAFAWKASDESFLQDISWLSNLKFRVGYGLSGSQAISPYQSLSILSTGGYYFGGTYLKGIGVGNYVWTAAGGNYTGLGEPDLKWETTGQFNAGIDLDLIKNRLSIVADIYNKITKDLHQLVELPIESGYSYTVRNMGKMRNRGFEISLRLNNVNVGEVQWSSSVNYFTNRNKILSLGDQYDYILAPALISGDGGTPFIGHVSMIGYPIGSFYGYKTDGIIQNQEQANELTASVGKLEPGEVRYVDLSGPNGKKDGIVDAYDRVIIGNPNPDFELNFNNQFTWKRFELAFNISAVYGHDVLNLNLSLLEAGTSANVESARMRDAWTVYNPSNTQPKIGVRTRVMSDRYIEDGSYLKLRNVMIAYNFNVKRSKWMSNAQVYVKGSNLVTLTKYFGYSPEINQYQSNQKPGVDYGSYPLTRSINAGFNVSFQ